MRQVAPEGCYINARKRNACERGQNGHACGGLLQQRAMLRAFVRCEQGAYTFIAHNPSPNSSTTSETTCPERETACCLATERAVSTVDKVAAGHDGSKQSRAAGRARADTGAIRLT